MKYTHYLTANKVRGNIISLESSALRSQEAFERALGEKVVKFTRTSSKYYSEVNIEVDFSDGSHHRFDIYGGMAFARVFLSEHGLYHAINKHTDIEPCTPDEARPYLGELSTKSSDKPIFTDFMDGYQLKSIMNAIKEDRGITITTTYDKSLASITIPHHEIQRFTVTEHPFGG